MILNLASPQYPIQGREGHSTPGRSPLTIPTNPNSGAASAANSSTNDDDDLEDFDAVAVNSEAEDLDEGNHDEDEVYLFGSCDTSTFAIGALLFNGVP